MTLDSELDGAEVVALLQPFVDGELSDDERKLVAEQIAQNPEYQAIVREQQEVRAVLRELGPQLAPAGLRERVVADLDRVEAERRESERRGVLAPIVGRIRAFGRGAMLMVPAAAAAGVLFLVATNAGWLEDSVGAVHVDGGMANSLQLPRKHHGGEPTQGQVVGDSDARADATPDAPPGDPALPNPDGLASERGFAIQIAPPRSLPEGVALVSDAATQVSSTATVRYRSSAGELIVDHQRRAGVGRVHGVGIELGGYEYHLARDLRGRAVVEFELAGVHHSLAFEGGRALRPGAPVSPDESDFRRLLALADALRGG